MRDRRTHAMKCYTSFLRMARHNTIQLWELYIFTLIVRNGIRPRRALCWFSNEYPRAIVAIPPIGVVGVAYAQRIPRVSLCPSHLRAGLFFFSPEALDHRTSLHRPSRDAANRTGHHTPARLLRASKIPQRHLLSYSARNVHTGRGFDDARKAIPHIYHTTTLPTPLGIVHVLPGIVLLLLLLYY